MNIRYSGLMDISYYKPLRIDDDDDDDDDEDGGDDDDDDDEDW